MFTECISHQEATWSLLYPVSSQRLLSTFIYQVRLHWVRISFCFCTRLANLLAQLVNKRPLISSSCYLTVVTQLQSSCALTLTVPYNEVLRGHVCDQTLSVFLSSFTKILSKNEAVPGSWHTAYHVLFSRWLVSFHYRSFPLFSSRTASLESLGLKESSKLFCMCVNLSPCCK